MFLLITLLSGFAFWDSNLGSSCSHHWCKRIPEQWGEQTHQQVPLGWTTTQPNTPCHGQTLHPFNTRISVSFQLGWPSDLMDYRKVRWCGCPWRHLGASWYCWGEIPSTATGVVTWQIGGSQLQQNEALYGEKRNLLIGNSIESPGDAIAPEVDKPRVRRHLEINLKGRLL